MNEIKPALTAEEWAEITDPEIHSREKMLYEISYLWGRPRPHAVAALCLDGQPFGFTREMLAALQRTITDAHVMHGDRVTDADERCECEAQLDLADAVADCVEALLPPEGK